MPRWNPKVSILACNSYHNAAIMVVIQACRSFPLYQCAWSQQKARAILTRSDVLWARWKQLSMAFDIFMWALQGPRRILMRIDVQEPTGGDTNSFPVRSLGRPGLGSGCKKRSEVVSLSTKKQKVDFSLESSSC